MKNKKLILGGVALLLSAVAVSSSIALYVYGDSSKTITIGGTVGADGDMAILKGTETHNTDFNPNNPYSCTYRLGLNKSEGSTYTQPSILGRVTVKVTAASTEILSHITASAILSGYTASTYWGNNVPTLTFGAAAADGSNYSMTATNILPIYAVGTTDGSATKYNNLTVNFATNLGSGEDFISLLAEKAISYTVQLGDKITNADYQQAYVLGSLNSWARSDMYKMVPNLESTAYEWMWVGKLTAGDQFKCAKSQNNETGWDFWSSGDNITVTSATAGDNKGIYWTGSSSTAPSIG